MNRICFILSPVLELHSHAQIVQLAFRCGDDFIEGGYGQDLLIGGQGEDDLNGGFGKDLLISGWTAYGTAKGIHTELLSTFAFNEYVTAVNLIQSNQPGYQTQAPDVTVFDDDEPDTMSGNLSIDVYFSGTGDTISDLEDDEVVIPLL